MWRNTETGDTYRLHSEIRAALRNVSLPPALDDDLLARFGIVPVPAPAPEEPEPTPKPEQPTLPSITPLQGRIMLHRAGLLESFVAFVASADEETQIAAEYATEWSPTSPLIERARVALGLTAAQRDALFAAAAEIEV